MDLKGTISSPKNTGEWWSGSGTENQETVSLSVPEVWMLWGEKSEPAESAVLFPCFDSKWLVKFCFKVGSRINFHLYFLHSPPKSRLHFVFVFAFFFFSGLNDPEATELVLGLLRIRFILWSIQGLPWKSWETQLKSQRLPQTPRSSGLRRLGIKLPFKYFYSLVPSANKETDWLCLVALWH